MQRFGAGGTLAVDGDASLFAKLAWDTLPPGSRSLHGGVVATAHYFLVDDIALGFSGGATHLLDRQLRDAGAPLEIETTELHGVVRLGLNLPFGRRVSLFPGIGVGAHSTRDRLIRVRKTAASPVDTLSDERRVGVRLEASLPLLLHPVPHAYVGLSPAVVCAGGRTRDGGTLATLHASAVLGTWWGPSDDVSETEESDPRAKRFGDRGTLVLASSLGLSAQRTKAGESPRSAFELSVAPGADYFVVDAVSLGLALGAKYTERERGGTSGLVSAFATAFMVAPRVGTNVPLAWWASWAPQLTVSIGHVPEVRRVAERTSARSVRVAAALDVPVLLHFAPHAFLGVGPGFEVADAEPIAGGAGRLSGTFRGATVFGVWW